MRIYWGGAAAASLLGIFGTLSAAPAPTPNLPNVPEVYKFDPGWPKPLPNNWTMGTVTGKNRQRRF
jgi:hypothetical protein